MKITFPGPHLKIFVSLTVVLFISGLPQPLLCQISLFQHYKCPSLLQTSLLYMSRIQLLRLQSLGVIFVQFYSASFKITKFHVILNITGENNHTLLLKLMYRKHIRYQQQLIIIRLVGFYFDVYLDIINIDPIC